MSDMKVFSDRRRSRPRVDGGERKGFLARLHVRCLLLGLASFCVGCSTQDVDCLARVGQTAAGKANALSGGANNSLGVAWQALCADLGGMTLDARVSARLRWDRSLAGTQIQVHTEAGQVELKGTVADSAQKQRALELAQSTVGADSVSDLLEVGATAP